MPDSDAEPFVSVFTPVHNGANYIADALESVRNQSYANYEHVVSINASTDETARIVGEQARGDRRLRWSTTDRLLSAVENLNRAGELCRGQWVVFLCHDDVLRPNCLERLIQSLERRATNRVALASFGAEFQFENGYISPSSIPTAGSERLYDGRDFLRTALGGRVPDALPGLSNAAVRLDVWRALGRFDPRFQHCDTFLWYRLLVDYDFLVIPAGLVGIRIHASQGTVAMRRSSRSIDEYRRFYPEFLRRFGDGLGVSWRARLAAPARWLSMAATEIAMHVSKRHFERAASVFGLVPVVWRPLLAGLCVRSYYAELRRTRELRQHVPTTMLYPD